MTQGSRLFSALFSTPEMDRTFSDEALVQAWLDAEAALASAESNLGVIPPEASAEIVRRAKVEFFDLATVREKMSAAKHPLVPTIWMLGEMCDGDAGGYVHWGATTQDIMDTGMVLQVREALATVDARLCSLIVDVAGIAERERGTLMTGRTHGQHALPITLGLKAASWLDELARHRVRMGQLRPRLLVGQLAGAAGTLASLGDDAIAVQGEFCRLLRLETPPVGWHVARDGLAELAALLGMVTGTCSRIASEVIRLQKTEVGELFEWHEEGNVGSSTMPQKRNPMVAESVVAVSRLVRRTTATALEAMVSEHERDMGAWQAEWAWVPEVFALGDAALSQTLDVVSHLVIDRDRMRANLDLTDGLLMAERVMIALGRVIGRQAAHDRVHGLAMEAVESRRAFAELLVGDASIVSALGGADAIRALLDPRTYLGGTDQFIDRAIEAARDASAPREEPPHSRSRCAEKR